MVLAFLNCIKEIYLVMPSKFWGRASEVAYHAAAAIVGGATGLSALFNQHLGLLSLISAILSGLMTFTGWAFGRIQRYKLEDENETDSKK